MKKIITTIKTAAAYIAGITAGAVMVAGFMVALLTPDKTRTGDFTNPREYWTSAAYRCDNFGADCAQAFQGCTTDESCEHNNQ